jgi:RNA-directed DNA polymerase
VQFRVPPETFDARSLQVLVDESWRGRGWAVETDIANCFEAIPKDRLIQAVKERVCDQSMLTLLRVVLGTGVMADGVVRRSVTGTPPGALCEASHNACGMPKLVTSMMTCGFDDAT